MGFTALEGYFNVIGSILEVRNDALLLGNGWGKPVWVVRARNWKLRGGENRLSGLLEGVSIASVGKAKRQGGSNITFVQVSVPREGYRYPSPLWDLSIDTGIRVPIPAAWELFL
ncbi:hypothetical protein GQ457_14G019310 [Hibiscus cannabinus]